MRTAVATARPCGQRQTFVRAHFPLVVPHASSSRPCKLRQCNPQGRRPRRLGCIPARGRASGVSSCAGLPCFHRVEAERIEQLAHARLGRRHLRRSPARRFAAGADRPASRDGLSWFDHMSHDRPRRDASSCDLRMPAACSCAAVCAAAVVDQRVARQRREGHRPAETIPSQPHPSARHHAMSGPLAVREG
jgi:hypothetical protein